MGSNRPRPRPVADGGTRHAALFESFPDPLLAYAAGTEPRGTGAGRRDCAEGTRQPVVREVNAAFERTFELDSGDVVGASLADVEVRGIVSSDREAPGASEGSDTPDPGGVDLEGDGSAPGPVTPEGHGGTPDESATTTVRELFDRTRDEDHPLRFGHRTEAGTRQFRVRRIAAGDRGYLLFTDITGPERGRRELASRIARLERLASVARHDLRNPLEVAAIRLEAARDTGEDVHFEKVAGALDRIEHIVEDVLAVGSGSVDPTDEVPIADVARGAWETVDTAGAELDVPTGLPTVRGDAERLRQLFENLFRNSVEHGAGTTRTDPGTTPDDSGATREDPGATRDDSSTTQQGPGASPDRDDVQEPGAPDVTVTVTRIPDGFAVADDGPGIPSAVRDRAFEAGFTTVSGNSGLGLSIVGEIAREHGWRVTLADQSRSADGQVGTRVEFTGVDPIDGEEDGGGETGGTGTEDPTDPC